MALFGHEAQLHYHNLETGNSFQNPQLPLQSQKIKAKVQPRTLTESGRKFECCTQYDLQAYTGARR